MSIRDEGSLLHEINLDTLTIYLRSKFPNRSAGRPGVISELTQRVKAVGYQTIGEIDRDVNAAEVAFREFEKEFTIDMPDVGVVSNSLALAEPKMGELFGRGLFAPHREKYFSRLTKYRHLVRRVE